MVHVYERFAEDYLAMPVLVGRKTESEKFAGWQSLPGRGGGERLRVRLRVRGTTEETVGKEWRGRIFATDGSRTDYEGG